MTTTARRDTVPGEGPMTDDQQRPATPLAGQVSDDPMVVILTRLDRLEAEIAAVRRIAEDAEHLAGDARDAVDEFDGRIDTLSDDVEDLDGGDYDDEIQALQDEVRYLTQRLDRLDLVQRSRSAAS